VSTKRGDAAQRDGTACELQVTLGNESQQMQNNQKKKRKLTRAVLGRGQMLGGPAATRQREWEAGQ
jgi:hypothetical protein